MKKASGDTWAIVVGLLAGLFVLTGVIGGLLYQQTRPLQQATHPKNITVNQFIRQVAPAAQAEQRKAGIPASITIVQAGTESNWGRSTLANKYNNLFGIKARTRDHRVRLATKETLNGKTITVKQYFRVYPSWAASIDAHTKLILRGTSDNPHRYDGVRTKSPSQAAWALQNNGYATDPNYANELLFAIRKFDLTKYDR